MSETRVSRAITEALVLTLVVVACAPPRSTEAALRPVSLEDRRRLQQDCNVTAQVCTRCHDFARVLLVRFDRPLRWQQLVARMRYMQSSGITDAEARQATTCLVFRAFGQRGLDELAAGPPMVTVEPARPKHTGPAPASAEPELAPAPAPAPVNPAPAPVKPAPAPADAAPAPADAAPKEPRP